MIRIHSIAREIAHKLDDKSLKELFSPEGASIHPAWPLLNDESKSQIIDEIRLLDRVASRRATAIDNLCHLTVESAFLNAALEHIKLPVEAMDFYPGAGGHWKIAIQESDKVTKLTYVETQKTKELFELQFPPAILNCLNQEGDFTSKTGMQIVAACDQWLIERRTSNLAVVNLRNVQARAKTSKIAGGFQKPDMYVFKRLKRDRRTRSGTDGELELGKTGETTEPDSFDIYIVNPTFKPAVYDADIVLQVSDQSGEYLIIVDLPKAIGGAIGIFPDQTLLIDTRSKTAAHKPDWLELQKVFSALFGGLLPETLPCRMVNSGELEHFVAAPPLDHATGVADLETTIRNLQTAIKQTEQTIAEVDSIASEAI